MVSGPVGAKAAVLQAGSVRVDVPRGQEPVIGGIEALPGKHDLEGFVARTSADIEALCEYTLGPPSGRDYDLGFVTFLQLDRVQHFLWRFTDPGDVTYPGHNPYDESVREFYRLVDRCCARLAEETSARHVIVVSDHGHGRRCERVLNVNEILRRADIVRARGGARPWASRGYWVQRAKVAVLNVAWALHLEEQAFSLARTLPNRKALKTSSYLHEVSANLAAASSIGGTNPFGGVDLKAEAIEREGLGTEEVVERIVKTLEKARVKDGRSPFKWIARREELYQGQYAGSFPEVLFELLPEYGVGWDLFGAIEGPNVMHRRISGGHRLTGFLGVVGAEPTDAAEDARVTDVAPTVLHLLGCEVPRSMRGRPLARG